MFDDLIRDCISYDPKTGDFFWRVKRGNRQAGDPAGKTHRDGYRVLCLAGRNFPLHRIAWFLTYGHWPSQQIDHINRVKADNRICNLRDVSGSENCRNKSHRSTTGLKGVTFHKKTGKWQAQICHPLQPPKYLGLFPTPDAAAAAVREASL